MFDAHHQAHHGGRKRSPNTIRVVWMWVASVPLSMAAEVAMNLASINIPGHGTVLPLSPIAIGAGGTTAAYLGFEYGTSFTTSLDQPKGHGGVEKMHDLKILTYTWTLLMWLTVALQLWTKAPLPLTEVSAFAAAIAVTYVSGNKATKLATNMGPSQPVAGTPPSPAPASGPTPSPTPTTPPVQAAQQTQSSQAQTGGR